MKQMAESHASNPQAGVSGVGMALFGAPLMQGRAEFREWIAEEIENGAARVRSYQIAVRQAQEGTLEQFGTFGGVEVYFYANEYIVGAVLIDPATMQAWGVGGLVDAQDVRNWADDLGLHPRNMGGR